MHEILVYFSYVVCGEDGENSKILVATTPKAKREKSALWHRCCPLFHSGSRRNPVSRWRDGAQKINPIARQENASAEAFPAEEHQSLPRVVLARPEVSPT